jgi:hypothetical protein
MRITERQLRSIIREELERSIDEMAWGGHIGMAEDEPYPHAPDHVSGEVASRNEESGSRSLATKYAQSDAWASRALTLYKNLPFTLWTAPYIGKGKTDTPGEGKLDALGIRPTIVNYNYEPDAYRVRFFPLADSVDKLSSLGYDVSQINPREDVVILYTSAATGAAVIPSPWMIFHSIFDSEVYAGPPPGLLRIVPSWPRARWAVGESLTPWMTMGSARQRNINSQTDAAAEAMAQELLDRRGFHLAPANKRGKPPPKAYERAIALIKAAGDEFRANAPGHLITVLVN